MNYKYCNKCFGKKEVIHTLPLSFEKFFRLNLRQKRKVHKIKKNNQLKLIYTWKTLCLCQKSEKK